VRGEILLEPGFFGRAFGASPELAGTAVGVEDDDVPRAEIVAVITFSGISGLSIPIAKIAGSRGTVIFVVAGSRARAGFEPAPGWTVAFEEFFIGAALVSQISSGEDSAGNRVDKFGGGFGGGEVRAANNVSRANESE